MLRRRATTSTCACARIGEERQLQKGLRLLTFTEFCLERRTGPRCWSVLKLGISAVACNVVLVPASTKHHETSMLPQVCAAFLVACEKRNGERFCMVPEIVKNAGLKQ